MSALAEAPSRSTRTISDRASVASSPCHTPPPAAGEGVTRRKADATCWVIERLRGDAAYHQGQAKRFSALAKTETSRADSLESTLLAVLTRLEPKATSFRFTDHKLSSRLSDAIEIDNQAAIPPELITSTTTENPDKTSIKKRIKAAIAQAINGLSKEEAARSGDGRLFSSYLTPEHGKLWVITDDIRGEGEGPITTVLFPIEAADLIKLSPHPL